MLQLGRAFVWACQGNRTTMTTLWNFPDYYYYSRTTLTFDIMGLSRKSRLQGRENLHLFDVEVYYLYRSSGVVAVVVVLNRNTMGALGLYTANHFVRRMTLPFKY
jgi:hypothetical protein